MLRLNQENHTARPEIGFLIELSAAAISGSVIWKIAFVWKVIYKRFIKEGEYESAKDARRR